LSVQKATLSRGSHSPKARFALQWHGVSVWRSVQKGTLGKGSRRRKAMVFRCGEGNVLEFGGLEGSNLELLLVSSESDVRQRQPQAEGQVRPSAAWCFGVAKATFWRLEGSNLKCQFRRRR